MHTRAATFLVNLKLCQGQWGDKSTLQEWYELASAIRLQQTGSNPSMHSIKRSKNMFEHVMNAVTRLYENQLNNAPAASLFEEIYQFYQWLGNQTGRDEQSRITLWEQWQPSNQSYPSQKTI